MKAEWQSKKLGEIVSIELGKTPSRSDKTLWDESRTSNNVWLSIADLLNVERNVVIDSKEYISDKGAALSKTVLKGTLLVSFKLTLGRLAFAGRDLFTNEAIAALSIFNEKEITKEFLFYFFQYFDWIKAAENDAKIKGMTLNKAKLKELTIFYPSIAEQQRIVAILDQAFEGIAKARANAEQNLQNARALFESHLQSVFTQRGDGWSEKRFDQACVLQRGFDLPTQSRVQGKYPLVTSNGVTDTHNEAKVKGPGVVTGRSGSIGNVFFVKDDFWPLNTALYVKDFCGNDPKFIFIFLQYFDLKRFATGTGVPTLNRNFVHSEKVITPDSVSEQKSIVEKTQSLLKEIQCLEALYQRKMALLDELKKSLLQQAFAGEL